MERVLLLAFVACRSAAPGAPDAGLDAAVGRTVPDASVPVVDAAHVELVPDASGCDGVELSPSLCVDRFEVTVADYRACAAAKRCSPPATTNDWEGIRDTDHALFDPLCTADPGDAGEDADKRPITCVDFEGAKSYCAFRQKRLPSAAEWDQIAGSSPYPWGIGSPVSGLLNACGSECVSWKKVHATELAKSTMPGLDRTGDAFPGDDGNLGAGPVGSFPMGNTPSGAGDVLGNVAEWTDEGGNGRHVVRGGSWLSSRNALKKSSPRVSLADASRSATIGFRCVK